MRLPKHRKTHGSLCVETVGHGVMIGGKGSTGGGRAEAVARRACGRVRAESVGERARGACMHATSTGTAPVGRVV